MLVLIDPPAWLDLAFEAVNIDALSPLEQAKICMCMGNLFSWVADFSGADELFTYALELDLAGGGLAEWRPTLLANRSACRLRLGKVQEALADADAAMREAGPRWGAGPARSCPQRHPAHFAPSFLELNGIL